MRNTGASRSGAARQRPVIGDAGAKQAATTTTTGMMTSQSKLSNSRGGAMEGITSRSTLSLTTSPHASPLLQDLDAGAAAAAVAAAAAASSDARLSAEVLLVGDSEVPLMTQQPKFAGRHAAPDAAKYYDPDSWMAEFKRLRASTVKNTDLVALAHKSRAVVATRSAVRSACCVRVLPNVEDVKAALRKPAVEQRKQQYDMWESASVVGSGGWMGGSAMSMGRSVSRQNSIIPSARQQRMLQKGRRRVGDAKAAASLLHMPPPAVWAIAGVNDSEINVYEAFSGRPLMRICDPKANVPAVSLLHAPFRGFMNRQLRVLPIRAPRDLLRLKSSQLVETDWVWVGFTDGSIRLFPANPNRIRDTDRAELFSKGELADLVFELPKYHNASIVSITRSPCHRDDEGADLSTISRLSTAVQYMTAAGSEGNEKSREHLSLMCTASADSSIVVWDVRKIYQTLEAMRMAKKEALGVGGTNSGGNSARFNSSGRMSSYYGGSVYASEVITIEGMATRNEDGSTGDAFTVRSSCTLIKVRPVMRLKGGVASLKSLQWVSSLVTTEGYAPRRRVADLTRNVEEPSAPTFIRERRADQVQTRFERREEHRLALNLCEEDMREVEAELEHLMPPLTEEPVQSMRVNLLIAGDNVGTVHVWNLDEELNRKWSEVTYDLPTPRSARESARSCSPRQRTPRTARSVASESPGRSSVGACSVVSPSIQLSAIDAPLTSARRNGGTSSAPPPTVPHTPNRSTASVARGGKSPGTTKKAKKSAGSRSSRARPHASTTGTPKRPTRAATSGTTAKAPRTPTRATGAGASVTTPKRPPGTPNSRVGGFTAKPRSRSSRAADSVAPNSPVSGALPSHRRATSVRAGVSPSRDRNRSCSPAHAPSSSGVETQGMSKFQVLAAHREDRTTPIREINRAIDNAGNGWDPNHSEPVGRRTPSMPQPSANTANRRTGRRGASAMSPQHASAANAPLDPRAGSTMLMSPGRASGVTVSPRRRQKSPSVPATAVGNGRSSPSRRGGSPSSASPQRSHNDHLSRTSRCRIEFTGGVAINGMAIDVPPRLPVTLRRIPEPKGRQTSLLEEPTPEEVEQRVLENSFDTLTEEKALFFVFQQLQMYLAVEGTVLNLRCVPVWQRHDEDGKQLFAQRGEAEGDAAVERQQLRSETVVDGSVELSPSFFAIHLRKLVLETHSQPVSELFLDHGRGHIWVARNDGIMSLFSKRTKKIVTRVPHPCADSALGPPSQKEWRAQQQELIYELSSGAPLRLTQHKECRGYDAAHFSQFVPFGRRTQVSLLMTANVVATIDGARSPSAAGGGGGGARDWRARGGSTKMVSGHGYEGFASSFTDFVRIGSALGHDSRRDSIIHSNLMSSRGEDLSMELVGNSTFTPAQHRRKTALQQQQQHHMFSYTEPSPQHSATAVPYALSSLMRLTSDYFLDGERVTKSLEAVKIDGCSDVSAQGRRREERLSELLHKLLWCRGNADIVRRVQKACYDSGCEAVARNVNYVMRELGHYSSLSLLHECYDLWCEHARHFCRSHYLRRQRTVRLARSIGAAAALERVVQRQRASQAFRRWVAWSTERRNRNQAAAVERLLVPVQDRADLALKKAASAVMLHMWEIQQRCVVFSVWQQWAEERREAAMLARLARDNRVSPCVHFEDDMDDISSHPATVSALASPHVPSFPSTPGDAAATPLGAATPGDRPVDESPREVSPLVRTFTRRYRTTSASPARPGGPPDGPPGRRDSFPFQNSTPAKATARHGSIDSGEGNDDDDDGMAAAEEEAALDLAVGAADYGTPAPKRREEEAATAPLVASFVDMARLLYRARSAIMVFRESRDVPDSVLDESWMSIVESAEGASETEDDAGRRLGVFSYGLLPLLQGLLSTADDVLPNLHESTVAEEVVSMLNGIQLCMDYVAADAEESLLAMLLKGAKGDHRSRQKIARRVRFSSPESVYIRLLSAYARRAAKDEESRQAMQEIVSERESFEAFLFFVDDERHGPH